MSIGLALHVTQVEAGSQLFLQEGPIEIQTLKRQFSEWDSALKRDGAFQGQTRQASSQAAYYIVQFKDRITVDDQEQLGAHNIEVVRYIPDDAYVVRAHKNTLEQFARQNPRVGDFVSYMNSIKVSSDLQMKSVFDRPLLKTVDVQLFSGAAKEEFENFISAHNWLINDQSGSTYEILLPFDGVQQLAQFEGVEWISDTPQMELLDFQIAQTPVPNRSPATFSLTGYETGTKIMNFDSAWARGLDGYGQLAGVTDTGLDKGDKVTIVKDFANLHEGFAWGIASNTWADFVGHGTHVSGSVLNSGLNSLGIRGGAYKARLVMQSVWSQKHKTLTTPKDLRKLYQQSYEMGVRVHSNSWGEPAAKGVYNKEAAQLDDFIWRNQDMVILFAAGNEGIDKDQNGRIDSGSLIAPSTAKNIITVGASENLVTKGGIQKKLGEIQLGALRPWPVEPLASDRLSNNAGGIVAFSSRGPTKDGRIKPDVIAPGSNILSNCSTLSGSGEMWGRYDSNYCFSGGTSMATPLTAGAAILVRQSLAKRFPNPSAASIKAVLMHTAKDLFPGQFGAIGESKGQEILNRAPNSDEGYGLVNVDAATSMNFMVLDEREGVQTGEIRNYTVNTPVQKVTLVYTDAPASPVSFKSLVNDLDLYVQIGDQKLVSESRIDNSEQVIIPANLQGKGLQITIRGVNVPQGLNGKQPYALVYSP